MDKNLSNKFKKIWLYLTSLISTQNALNLLAFILLIFLIYGFINLCVLKIIVWPIVLITILISFKEQLLLLISKVVKWVGPWGELQFQQDNTSASMSQEEIEKLFPEIIKKQIEEIQKQNLQKAQLINQIAAQNIIINFERIFNDIFSSQINLLKLIASKKGGASSSEIQFYFEELKTIVVIYKNWTWFKYFEFLTKAKLVDMSPNQTFVITPYGSAFLNYINSMNYTKNNGL